MPENVTGFQPTGNLKKSLIDLAYFDMFPRRSPTFFREEPTFDSSVDRSAAEAGDGAHLFNGLDARIGGTRHFVSPGSTGMLNTGATFAEE